MTAYLVDPALICSTGRSRRRFDEEGSGNALLFQAGVSKGGPEGASDLIQVPLDIRGAEKDVRIGTF